MLLELVFITPGYIRVPECHGEEGRGRLREVGRDRRSLGVSGTIIGTGTMKWERMVKVGRHRRKK